MPQRDVVNDRGWQRAFEDPILLPFSRKLVTLLDAVKRKRRNTLSLFRPTRCAAAAIAGRRP